MSAQPQTQSNKNRRKNMKLNSLNKKFALASVSLLTISTLAGFGGLVNVNAKTTVVTDQVSNGEVAIYAQSAAGNAVATTNNDGTNPDTGVANNQTGGHAGNTGKTKNDGSQQSSLEGSTPSVMANVTFSATKYTGTGVPTGCCRFGIQWCKSHSDFSSFRTC